MDSFHFSYICVMKNTNLIICALLFSFDLFGGNTFKSFWKPIHQSFDSTVYLLEKGFAFNENNRHRDEQINFLYNIAKENKKEPVFLWRAKFWDARSQLKKNNSDSTIHLIERAYTCVDSINYSYDYIRILHLWTIMHKEKPYLVYKNLKNISEYYANADDLFMLAHAYIDMGNILNRLKDHSKALDYFFKADSFYRQLNEIIYQAKNQLNISSVLYLMNEKEDADHIVKRLLENPVCQKDTNFYINALLSLVENEASLNRKLVFKVYNLSVLFANKGLLIRSESLMGRYYQYKNLPDSALMFYRKACQRLNNRYIDLLLPILKNMSECFSGLHNPDSAYFYLNKYEVSKDSLTQVNSLAEIRRIESRAAIAKYELELRQTEDRANFHFILTVLVCSFIVFIAVLICYIFWKRHREAKIKKQLKDLENKELTTRLENESLQKNYFKIELGSKERELTSNSLILTEKNQMLKMLSDTIEKEKVAGNIYTGTATKINQIIKRHLGKGDEWEFFRAQFEKVHPDFFFRIKILYPSITEGELRLCAYVRIGMENKQIAQMLSLQTDSIKKTRYRIRKKMGIELEGSLEDFLRNI